MIQKRLIIKVDNAEESALKSKLTLNKSATLVLGQDNQRIDATTAATPIAPPAAVVSSGNQFRNITIGVTALAACLVVAMVFWPTSEKPETTRIAVTTPEIIEQEPEAKVFSAISNIIPVKAPLPTETPVIEVVSVDDHDETNLLMRQITKGTLDALRSSTGVVERQAAVQLEPANTLQKLVNRALEQGQSNDYIDILLNDALEKGQVKVPAALINADGKVDTPSILAMFAQ